MITAIAVILLLAADYAPVGPNFVANSSLEQWKAGAPVGWQLVRVGGRAAAFSPARQSPENHGGKVALKLVAPEDPTLEIQLRQEITLDPAALPAGGLLRLSAAIHCASAGAITLALHFCEGNEERVVSAVALGTGAWETLACEVAFTPGVDPGPLEIVITRSAGHPGDALVDDVQLRGLAEAAEAPLEPRRPLKRGHTMMNTSPHGPGMK